jgi:hypothetical protein
MMGGEYGVGSSAGARCIETGVPMGSPCQSKPLSSWEVPHRLRRQPRLNRLRARSSGPRAFRVMASCVS